MVVPPYVDWGSLTVVHIHSISLHAEAYRDLLNLTRLYAKR